MYRIGIDLGGTNIGAGVVDERDQIVSRASAPTPKENADTAIPDAIAECVGRALHGLGITRGEAAGAGLGIPGSCDTKSGIVRYAHNLGWDGFPAAALLERRLGLPVRIANDGDCAALGEAVAGAARGCESALVVTLGTGIGGGYILNGKILSGFRGLGGEFGHMRIALNGEICSCGERGCWEAYASATALIRQAEEAAALAPGSLLNRCGALTGKTIYAAADAGDAVAQGVVRRYAEYVGAGLVNLINVLFPQRILLGGGVSGAGDALLVPVREYVYAHCFVRDRALLPDMRAAALGSDAGIVGAAALIME